MAASWREAEQAAQRDAAAPRTEGGGGNERKRALDRGGDASDQPDRAKMAKIQAAAAARGAGTGMSVSEKSLVMFLHSKGQVCTCAAGSAVVARAVA